MKSRRTKILGVLAVLTVAVSLPMGSLPVAADGGEPSPYATEVVAYSGTFGPSPYDDPNAVLGKPSTQCDNMGGWGGSFRVKLVEPAYNVDLDGQKVITTLNAGANITVKFDHHLMNDPDNPYGIDLLVFGNAFFTGDGFVSDSTNMDTYTLQGPPASCFSEPVTVSVSQDGSTWHEFSSGPYADGMFPTHAYEWDSVNHQWTDNEMDFTRPVDPSLSLDDFGGISAADAIDLYDGSGGGTGYDLDEVGLDWIQYVKVTGGSPAGEIDAFSDVAPEAGPDITVDLRATGINGEVVTLVEDYTIPDIELTEDTFTIDAQTALGAITYYCQQEGVNLQLLSNQGTIMPRWIGDDPDDIGLWLCQLNQEEPPDPPAEQPVVDGDYVHFYYAMIPDVTIDLRATGMAGDIFDATDYTVPFGTVTEDGFVIDSQTAMGALVHYCQDNSINVEIQSGEYGLYVYQVGDDSGDENSWTYTVDESTPWVSGDQYDLTGGESVHWANYMLGLYSLSLSLDVTEIEPGDSLTATVTYTDGDGNPMPADGADVYVTNSTDAYGNPVPPGVDVGDTNASGECTFTWNDEGTYYPYAEWDGKDTVYQWPVVSFTCSATTEAWDVNGDGVIDVFDLIRVGNHFGETGTPGWIPEDVNSDGVIDVFDMIVVGNHFGE
jgi:hypothetical protein